MSFQWLYMSQHMLTWQLENDNGTVFILIVELCLWGVLSKYLMLTGRHNSSFCQALSLASLLCSLFLGRGNLWVSQSKWHDTHPFFLFSRIFPREYLLQQIHLYSLADLQQASFFSANSSCYISVTSLFSSSMPIVHSPSLLVTA